MKIAYKDYRIEPNPGGGYVLHKVNRDDNNEIIVKYDKRYNANRDYITLIGYYSHVENAVKAIMEQEMIDDDSTVTLAEYVAAYKEQKEIIIKELKKYL
ncbi:hypothetical protein KKH23_06355 [Patescibacteria group bacterium]|uniref:Uncharacterized protein n=1 Tax=viral metagenome TaxID=1070528 RepID=A0A6M3MG82_9ZZZZ|nr:hypothetical protein [Patescibacteria group bacterium]MBU0846796.1 hypothetical protein [Patescibacteria group bacterium]